MDGTLGRSPGGENQEAFKRQVREFLIISMVWAFFKASEYDIDLQDVISAAMSYNENIPSLERAGRETVKWQIRELLIQLIFHIIRLASQFDIDPQDLISAAMNKRSEYSESNTTSPFGQ